MRCAGGIGWSRKSDIYGAVLMTRKGSVIAGDMTPEGTPNSGLSDLLPRLMEISSHHSTPDQRVMFPHTVKEHNGHRILARSVIEDLILLVLIPDSCYMGLTMLDMENSILRIREILNSPIP